MYIWTFILLVFVSGLGSQKISNGENDFYKYFVTEAPKHPGNFYGMNNSSKDIPWLDMKLLDKGAVFYKKHYLGISGAFMWVLMETLALKPVASVIVSTGHLLTESVAYQHLLKTILHLDIFCKSGSKMFIPETEAYNSFKKINRRHRSANYVANSVNRTLSNMEFIDGNLIKERKEQKSLNQLLQAVKADLEFVDTNEAPEILFRWDSEIPVSQFDLGVIHFIMYAHVVMTPEIFGILNATPQDFKAYVYSWAVIGRQLGIEDRFNVALNLKPEMYQRFYTNIILGSLKIMDENNIYYMNLGMEVISKNFMVPSILRLRCWMYNILKASVKGFEGKNIEKILDLEDRVCLTYLNIYSGPLNLSPLVTNLGTYTFVSWFQGELAKNSIKD